MIELSTNKFDEFGVTTTWLAAYGTAILTTGSMSPEALASHTLPAVFRVSSAHPHSSYLAI